LFHVNNCHPFFLEGNPNSKYSESELLDSLNGHFLPAGGRYWIE
jgi:hypothetical protein